MSSISRSEQSFDTVRITAWGYAVFCVTFWPIAVFTASPHLLPGQKLAVLAVCAAFAALALTATRRKRIGYYFCFLFSVLILPGVPIGTILGWNMLRALRRNRREFWAHGSGR